MAPGAIALMTTAHLACTPRGPRDGSSRAGVGECRDQRVEGFTRPAGLVWLGGWVDSPGKRDPRGLDRISERPGILRAPIDGEEARLPLIRPMCHMKFHMPRDIRPRAVPGGRQPDDITARLLLVSSEPQSGFQGDSGGGVKDDGPGPPEGLMDVRGAVAWGEPAGETVRGGDPVPPGDLLHPRPRCKCRGQAQLRGKPLGSERLRGTDEDPPGVGAFWRDQPDGCPAVIGQ